MPAEVCISMQCWTGTAHNAVVLLVNNDNGVIVNFSWNVSSNSNIK